MVRSFFSKSNSSSGNLDESNEVDDINADTSVKTKDTGKKRILSDSPLSDDSKKPNLNKSPTLAEKVNFEFDSDTPNWVIQLFTMCENMSNDIKTLSTKFDKFERFQSQITKRVSSLENQNSENKKKIEILEKNMTSTGEKFVDVSKKIVDFESGMGFLNNMCEELKNQMSEFSKNNHHLMLTVDSLSKQVDANEQHNRSECLLLHGIPETTSETPSQSKAIFSKEISKHLGIQIKDEYIRRVHRLGKPRENGNKPRPIIARIWSSELRNDIYSQKKLCKNTPISITENLTKRRIQSKKDAENRYGEKNVWTKELS